MRLLLGRILLKAGDKERLSKHRINYNCSEMRPLLECISPGLPLTSVCHRASLGQVSDLHLKGQSQAILSTWHVFESVCLHPSPGPLPKLQLQKESLSHPNSRLNLPDFLYFPFLKNISKIWDTKGQLHDLS